MADDNNFNTITYATAGVLVNDMKSFIIISLVLVKAFYFSFFLSV